MVYIKLTPQMWIVSGLEKTLNPASVRTIDNNKYVAYTDFKIAAQSIEQPIHSLIKRQNIISNIEMRRINKQAELTPEQKQQMQEIKARGELRKLNKYKNNKQYFDEVKDQTVKDMSKSISFGMTFIFSFFLAGLTGYYFGTYFLGLEFTYAMMVAAVFIMGTIIMQTVLYIIKQDRDDKIRAYKAKEKRKIYKPKSNINFNFKMPERTGEKTEETLNTETNKNVRPKID